MLISAVKTNLTGMLHGGSLNKIRNIEELFERCANTILTNIDPIETERTVALTSVIYDDIYNYALPSDYKKIYDLLPQDERETGDVAIRYSSQRFDLKKAFAQKTIAIEGSEGTKFIRINWRTTSPVVLHSMNSLTSNGTWAVVASATGLRLNTLTKISGNSSIEFDASATGDGISNTGMTAIDLTDEDEIADLFLWLYIPTSANLTNFNSATVRWGNDITANYWQSAAVSTQADGTALKVGWNLLRFTWAGATETGTVAPATIDSFRLVVDIDAAITNLKVDSIVFAVGRNFDIKYYSQYSFKNTAGTYLSKPTSDDDTMILTGTGEQIFLLECLKACAQQMEGSDSTFDIDFARLELNGDPQSRDPDKRVGLYAKYRREYPSKAVKESNTWSAFRSGNFRARG